MHRLLLLRPISRAIRAQGAAQCNRNLVSGLSAPQSRGLHATSPVSKRKKITAIDDMFFGDESDVAAPTLSADKESKTTTKAKSPETARPIFESETHTRGESSEGARPTPVTGVEGEAPQESQVHLVEPVDFSFLAEVEPEQHDFNAEASSSDTIFNADEYFSTWFSSTVKDALDGRGATQHDYICTLLETDAVQDLFTKLEINEAEDFERLWGLYEWKKDTDSQSVVPILTFLLRHGVQLIPPSLDSTKAEACVEAVEPSVIFESLTALKEGQWRIDDASKPPSKMIPYPNLMKSDSLLDPRDVVEFPATPDTPFNNRVIIRNHRSVFHNYAEGAEDDLEDDELDTQPMGQDMALTKSLPVDGKYYHQLHQSILMRRSVVLQTGKGKIRRVAYLVLVGDGNGLVGYGEGKHGNSAAALKAARIAAVRNMDWVERFEKRTIWTEMSTKFGATKIFLRPRPVGFGLRCNPNLHQILRAAGLKDISGKVWGSRNKLNVIKAAFRMLHAGHAPTGMGDGIGGKGRKTNKGVGLKGKAEIERARGRKIVSLRK